MSTSRDPCLAYYCPPSTATSTDSIAKSNRQGESRAIAADRLPLPIGRVLSAKLNGFGYPAARSNPPPVFEDLPIRAERLMGKLPNVDFAVAALSRWRALRPAQGCPRCPFLSCSHSPARSAVAGTYECPLRLPPGPFPRALPSIARMRSLVTKNSTPTSSRVRDLGSDCARFARASISASLRVARSCSERCRSQPRPLPFIIQHHLLT